MAKKKTSAEIHEEGAVEAIAAEQFPVKKASADMMAGLEDGFSIGVLNTINYYRAHNDILYWAAVSRVKREKAYRKGGMTWSEFCKQILDEPVSTIDRKLNEIKPLYDQFMGNFQALAGMNFNQLKFLSHQLDRGDAEVDGSELVYGDMRVKIAAEEADNIVFLVNTLKEELGKREQEADEKVRDMESRLKAKDALAKKSREEAADLKEQLERRDLDARAEEFESADEQMKISRVEKNLLTFKGVILEMRPENKKLLKDATPRLKAEYLAALYEMREKIMTAYDGAVEKFGTPAAHGAFDQEKGVNLDDVPDPEDQDGVDPENVIAIQKKKAK